MTTPDELQVIFYEVGATEDATAATERILGWLSTARREGAADALNSAADDWPDQGIVSLWLRKRAEGGV